MFIMSWQDKDGDHQCEIRGTTHRIGRSLENDARVADMSVSRHHAIITQSGDRYVLTDLDSQNGIRFAGQYVKQHPIEDGDSVLIGDVSFRFLKASNGAESLQNVRHGSMPMMPEGSIILSAADISMSQGIGQSRNTVLGQSLAAEAGSADMLAALATVAQELVRQASLDDLLKQIIELIFLYIPVENAFLLLYDAQLDELHPKVARSRRGGQPETTISRQIALAVFNERNSVLTLDAREDPRFALGRSILAQGIRSVMCVPLWVKGETLGVIFVDSTTQTVTMEESHLHFLTMIASVAAAHIEQARLHQKIRQETSIKERLMRYQSPSLVDQIMMTSENTTMLEPCEREVSVLFADMVGFSTRTEHMAPKDVALLLNRFFSEIVDVIFQYEGTLDKFIGDAVMAFFGAPHDQPDHAVRAVRAAIAIRDCLHKHNEGHPPGEQISVRIGINSGVAVSGDIGSDRRMEYTVLGNTVNVASRLESMVATPGEIVVGPSTYEAIRNEIPAEPLGKRRLKGIGETVAAYRILES